MFLEIVALSFLVAWLRGGRPKADLGFKHVWLAPLAFGVQLVNMFLLPVSVHTPLTMVTYLLILSFAWANRFNQGVRFIAVGMLLNIMVIFANGGKMPVDIQLARSLGIPVENVVQGLASKQAPLTDEARLTFLADVVPLPFPIPRVISLGDIFAVTGSFLLIQGVMGRPIIFWRSKQVPS